MREGNTNTHIVECCPHLVILKLETPPQRIEEELVAEHTAFELLPLPPSQHRKVGRL